MTSNFDLILDVNISDNATRDGDISGIDIDLDQAPPRERKRWCRSRCGLRLCLRSQVVHY
jgi:hypothetical protein